MLWFEEQDLGMKIFYSVVIVSSAIWLVIQIFRIASEYYLNQKTKNDVIRRMRDNTPESIIDTINREIRSKYPVKNNSKQMVYLDGLCVFYDQYGQIKKLKRIRSYMLKALESRGITIKINEDDC